MENLICAKRPSSAINYNISYFMKLIRISSSSWIWLFLSGVSADSFITIIAATALSYDRHLHSTESHPFWISLRLGFTHSHFPPSRPCRIFTSRAFPPNAVFLVLWWRNYQVDHSNRISIIFLRGTWLGYALKEEKFHLFVICSEYLIEDDTLQWKFIVNSYNTLIRSCSLLLKNEHNCSRKVLLIIVDDVYTYLNDVAGETVHFGLCICMCYPFLNYEDVINKNNLKYCSSCPQLFSISFIVFNGKFYLLKLHLRIYPLHCKYSLHCCGSSRSRQTNSVIVVGNLKCNRKCQLFLCITSLYI